jgi:polyisoprenoid-binding protein YceI
VHLGIFTYTVIAIASVLSTAQSTGGKHAIDTRHSTLTVRVSTAGVFSGFGDKHEIAAPIAEGIVDEGARRVEFVIQSRQMMVLDPKLSPDKREQVQERMTGPDVLDVSRFSQIKFESTSVEQGSSGHLLVHGQLSLHGVTRPLIVNVQTGGGHYVGQVTFKQRDFGITPVSVAGGTVKVKDELQIEFDIRTITQTAVVRR